MGKGRRYIRPEFIAATVFIAVILVMLIGWQKHSVIGWIVFGVITAAVAYALYRLEKFRNRAYKTTGEPVPQALYNQVISRANVRCQNPDCQFTDVPEIHHINRDNQDNALSNLIALCPNCHKDAHEGRYSINQLSDWLKKQGSG